MSKLFDFKEWLSIADAAQHLTTPFGEVVTEADVLRYALNGHLKISVNFVNYAHARKGCLRYKSEIRENEFENSFYLGGNSSENKYIYFVYSDKEIIKISGIRDLPMFGGERLEVKQEFQTLTNGPNVKHRSTDYCFIEDLQGHMYSIQIIDNEIYQREDYTPLLRIPNYYPASKLPPDRILVVRTAALREFELKMIETPQQDADKPIITTERNSLLTIIGLMAKDWCGNDLSKPYQLAKEIQKSAEVLGIKISDDTIANKLKDAKSVLDEKSE